MGRGPVRSREMMMSGSNIPPWLKRVAQGIRRFWSRFGGPGQGPVRSREMRVIGSNLPPWPKRVVRGIRRLWSRFVWPVFRRQGFWWIVFVVATLALGSSLTWVFWEELHNASASDASAPSFSTTIRNVALVIGGIVAMLIALWRSLVAGAQAETAQQSLDMAKQSLRNERYQQGTAMLGNEILTVRLGGVYALSRLAAEYPEEYHVQVMEVLCAFIRNPTPMHEYETGQALREDVQAALIRIGHRGDQGLAIEKCSFYWLDLYHAELTTANLRSAQLASANLVTTNLARTNLVAADLSEARCTRANFHEADLILANLSGAALDGADLSAANLSRAKLGGADLSEANLSRAKLGGADLTGARLWGADVSGAHFAKVEMFPGGDPEQLVPCEGLTQVQLDEARAELGNPPVIPDGMRDAETGAPLVWRD